jgi:hypothetical protein
MVHEPGSDPATSGTFLGVEVRTGEGGGLASGIPTPSGRAHHFHAARLPELGDVVLAITRVFDTTTGAALGIELRAFAASAPGRGALAQLPASQFAQAPGAIAIATLELAAPGDRSDDRRPVTLERCVVTDAAPTAAAARGVAEWMRATWETELAFGSWPAVHGTIDAFAIDGGEVADWARQWLAQSEHHVDGAEPAAFLKVLSPAWLNGVDVAADAQPDAASNRS